MTRRAFEWSRLLPAVTLALALAGTYIAHRESAQLLHNARQASFDQEVTRVTKAIQEQFNEYEAVVRGGQALFAASERVSHSEWVRYVAMLDLGRNYPGLYGMGYVHLVPASGKEAFLALARSEVDPAFAIHPAGQRDFYAVINYFERMDGGRGARGFDVSTEPKRWQAAETARDTGQVSISEQVKLLDSENLGFIMYLPVYANGTRSESVEERRANLRGWVSGLIRSDLMMADMLKDRFQLIGVEIVDGPPRSLAAADGALFSDYVPVRIGQRLWTAHVFSKPEFAGVVDDSRPNLILGAGAIISLLLFASTQLLVSTRSRALEIARGMTRELARFAAFQRAILQGANYSILAADLDGMITHFNPAAERLLGYRSEEVVWKANMVSFHDPEEIRRRAAELEEELDTGVEAGVEALLVKPKAGIPEEREWTYVCKGGARIPVLLSVSAIRSEEGDVVGYMGIAADITERKRIERMKSEFISTVSHELRTPLTSIRGSLGLVMGGKSGEVPKGARDLLSIAHKNCERLVRLINDILDIEKIESGRIRFELKPVELVSLVSQVIEANRPYAEEFQVCLKAAGMPRALVMADADRITQVVTNLISNAIKFSPPGGAVTVEVTRRAEGVRVGVIDSGPGIPEKFHAHIFQKFSQADSSDTRAKGGTGLGLSISKAIIERHGGKIDFETEPGRTVFYFDLPEAKHA